MSPAEAVFYAALDRPDPADRAAYLDAACAGDPDLRARVERLLVPPQGFGMFQMIEGAPEFRDFIRARAGKGITPKGAARIYISRSALPIQRGSVLGETVLEERLIAEGYEVFHPQKHSFEDQIAAYRAALWS